VRSIRPDLGRCGPADRRRYTADAGVLSAAAAQHGVTVGAVLHQTDKSIVAAGIPEGLPVIVKMPATDDPYWTGRRAHEPAVYRVFAATPPPFPALRHLVVVERIRARPNWSSP